MKLALVLLLLASPIAAQRIDRDTCLTCRDVPEHFAGGVAVALATRIVFPKGPAWKRLLIVGGIALAFEAGQANAQGAFGPKDWVVGMAGAVLVELVW